MDSLLIGLISWQILFCGAGIAAVTWIVRLIIEFILDNPNVPLSKGSKFWKDLFLPILPIILGIVFGLSITSFPYPVGISDYSSRAIFGSIAGTASGYVFRIIKAMFAKEEAAKEIVAAVKANIEDKKI